MAQQANIMSFDVVKTSRSSAAKKAGRKSNSSTQKQKKVAAQSTQKSASLHQPKESRMAQAKRKRAKEKAGKAFSKQFADKPSQASSDGPRAAVYKGQMGSTHKKATKMQNKASSARKSGSMSIDQKAVDYAPKLAGTFVVVACLALTCAFLYPTAKQFYSVSREYDQLQAEYMAIQERNNTIQAEVDSLSSDAGIEDKARSEFGWAKHDEKVVNVTGLSSDSEGDTEKTASSYTKTIPSGSIEAPETWYSPVLDVLFGVA